MECIIMYVISERTPFYLGAIVEDERPRFKTFTLAKKYFIYYCREALEEARKSAHKSFTWCYSQAPSNIRNKDIETFFVEIDLKNGGAYGGPYTVMWIDKLPLKNYGDARPCGPLISTIEEYDDYMRSN